MRIVAACLLPAALLGCASIQTRMTETTPKAAVTVDSRIELMGVIQLLSDYFLVSYLDSSYKLEAAEYFASCRDHPAVSSSQSYRRVILALAQCLMLSSHCQIRQCWSSVTLRNQRSLRVLEARKRMPNFFRLHEPLPVIVGFQSSMLAIDRTMIG